jgi:hypothetical protein
LPNRTAATSAVPALRVSPPDSLDPDAVRLGRDKISTVKIDTTRPAH